MATERRDSGTGKGSAFDKIVTTLMNEYEESGLLEDCMSMDLDRIERVPLRYKLIAMGFVNHSTLEEVNDMLKRHGYAALYSRNLWEASLIYAFHRGLAYSEWKNLQETCRKIREKKELRDKYFTGSRISLADIHEYVEANSDIEGRAEITKHLTRAMDDRIIAIASGKGDFKEFLFYGFESLSQVREKTRYYFCKYLYYYLDSCIERYLEARRAGEAGESDIDELAIFKGITELKRKRLSDQDVRTLLRDKGLSLGALFDAFNYFYYGYVSLDWMEVLLEYYGDIHSVPSGSRSSLAASLRRYEPARYKNLSDDEVLAAKQEELDRREEELDRAFSLDDPSKGYQRNRAGENTVRRYIKGGLDIDRNTLICFLIFFGAKADIPQQYLITSDRLDEILEECGFAELRRDDEFDEFIIRYLESDEPVDMLMCEVTDYALDEENFFLYKTYIASRSAEADMEKLLKESD